MRAEAVQKIIEFQASAPKRQMQAGREFLAGFQGINFAEQGLLFEEQGIIRKHGLRRRAKPVRAAFLLSEGFQNSDLRMGRPGLDPSLAAVAEAPTSPARPVQEAIAKLERCDVPECVRRIAGGRPQPLL